MKLPSFLFLLALIATFPLSARDLIPGRTPGTLSNSTG
jgi:hypothetical protein